MIENQNKDVTFGRHTEFMRLALEQAEKAYAIGEVPVGCVVVCDDKVIATGYNTRETEQSALGHAEINAIEKACKALSSWRLSNCRIYVTLEPCMMCMGAILNARFKMVIFGASDPKRGVCGEMPLNQGLLEDEKTEVLAGICEVDCQAILVKFFSQIRAAFE